MKKIITVGMIVIMIASLLAGLVPSSFASIDDWTINGDTVEREDDKVYMGATPYSIGSEGWVYFDFISKTYTGDIDVAWGFDVPNVRPTKAELYSPHNDEWTTNHQQTFYNVSSFSPSTSLCDFGNSYNTHHYEVTYQIPVGWNNATVGRLYDTVTSIVCFDSHTNDANDYTIYWYTAHSNLILWKDITNSYTKLPYETHHNYGGMNTWYCLKNVPVIAGHSYQVRIWVDVPVTKEGTSGKYWWIMKPSSETIRQAITNNHLYTLDPWWNATWDKKQPILINNTGGLSEVYYQIDLNITYDSDMQTDFDDIRVVNDTLGSTVPFAITNKTDSSHINIVFNCSYLPADTWINSTYYLYYDNNAASSTSDKAGTYLFYDGFEDQTLNKWAGDTGVYASSAASSRVGTYGIYRPGAEAVVAYLTANLAQRRNVWTEMWFQDRATSFDAGIGIVQRGTGLTWAPDEMMYFYNKENANYIDILERYAASNYDHQVGVTINANTWYHSVCKVYNQNSYMNLYDSNSVLVKAHSYSPLNTLINVSGETGLYTFRDVYLDEYIVRKYQEPHPTAQLGAEEAAPTDFIPPDPINLASSTSNFWVNYTWNPDSGNITNAYNVTWNGTWSNTTNEYMNQYVGAHGWGNITVWAWNSSGSGTISTGSVTDSVQVPNNPITITNTSDWSGYVNESVYLDFDYTDVDGDTAVFTTNATEGSLDSATGIFTWTTAPGDEGTYHWYFTASDGYGSSSTYVSTIIVSYLPTIEITTIVGSTWINWSWNGSGTYIVYVDGKFKANTTVNQMILTGLKSRESHEIRVFDSGILIVKDISTTFYSFSLFYLIIGLSMGTMLFTLFLKQEMVAIILGTITFVFGMFGFYISYPMHLSSFSYIFVAILAIAFIWILTAAYSMIQSDKNQEDFI